MRNKVAKKLRKAAGNQKSTSNRIEYKEAKKEHMRTEVFTKPLKLSERSIRNWEKNHRPSKRRLISTLKERQHEKTLTNVKP